MEQPRTRVFVHVGAPKTGTSFLQHVLWTNRDTLAARGVHYPLVRPDGHFLAGLDLMELDWGGLEQQAVGAWDALAARVRAIAAGEADTLTPDAPDAPDAGHRTVIVSHEILAHASAAQARRALESFGDDVEVHVVYSARDLVRQVPAEWQENVKHRRSVTFGGFLDQIQDPDRTSRLASWFWGVQELPAVLDRWGSELPPERVHVVTVPQPGADPWVLFGRFCRVLGLDTDGLDLAPDRANPSLGVAEATLLRRLNERLNPRLPGPRYRELVRELLAHRTLSVQRVSARLTVPDDVRLWLGELVERWMADVEARGYDVVGDLAELRPSGDAEPFVDPDVPDEAEVAAAATTALEALLFEAAAIRDHEEGARAEVDHLRGEVARLHEEVERLHGEVRAAHLTPSYRVRQRIVSSADGHRSLQMALAGYRRVRGRSSRSA